jgi:hypothetical protein
VPEQIIRPKAAWTLLGVGHSKGEKDFAPRLVKVRLGKRGVGYTQSSIERLIAELIAESADIVPAPLPRPRKQIKRRAS